MKESLWRIWAIVKTDFLIRVRRPSTVVILLMLWVAAYLFVPDPSTGRALMQCDEQRGLYNSALIATGTGSICSILLGLFGFYLVSNTLRRDIQSRTGFVIASTGVLNIEYLFGKFLGNIVFLTGVISGFAGGAMVMQLLRGEGPLQPHTFVWHYLLILSPVVVFVSVMAMIFESIPFLSGKIGDIAYFFVWIFSMTIPMIGMAQTKELDAVNWGSYIDIYGLGFVVRELQTAFHSKSISIGSSPFDATLKPVIFNGFVLRLNWILPWMTSLVCSLPLLGFVTLIFHRFDPVCIKTSTHKSRQKLLTRLNLLLKPVADLPLALIERLLSALPQNSLINSVVSDFLVIFRLYPMVLLLVAGFAVAATIAATASVQQKTLPIIFAVLTPIIADVATREKRSGTLGIVTAAPLIKPNFVVWKLATALVLTLCFTLIPLLRLVAVHPKAALSLAIGSVLVASVATSLGILTSNPKTFTALFLFFWYLVMDSKGQTPGFDFAGFYGVATPTVQVTYVVIALVMLMMAQGFYWWKQRQE